MQRFRFRIALAFAAVLLSSLPFLFGIFQTVAGSRYTGIRPLNASDFNVNLSWLQQFREGRFLLKNLYTTEPHRAFLVRPVYWLLTQPFRVVAVSNSIALHSLRLFCAIGLMLLLFPLIHRFTGDWRTTNIAVALLAFSSGMGILLKGMFPGSPDLGVPESILFLSLGEPPHFLYSLLLLWAGVVCLYNGRKDAAFLLVYLLCLVLLWWEHPFDAVTLTVLGIVELWHLQGRMRLLLPLGIVVVSVPPYLYYRALESLPAYSGWSAQNVMLSSSVGSVLAAFLPLILLAAPAVFQHRKDRERSTVLLFLTIWIAAQFVLTFLPFNFQRRLTAGVQFPLAVLSAFTLNRIRSWLPVAGVIVLLSSTNLYMMQQQIQGISSKAMPFYLPESYEEAFQWLQEQKQEGAVVSGFITGNFIPAYTGHPVFMGHSALTPEIAQRRRAAAAFYQNPRQEFLNGNQIRYVFWGREEQRLSVKHFDSYFSSGYGKRDVRIFPAASLTGSAIARLH